MRELNRYPVANSKIVLIHTREDDGEECVWAAMCPGEPGLFRPELSSECFIVASSEEQDGSFAGLDALSEALHQCAVECDKRRPPAEVS